MKVGQKLSPVMTAAVNRGNVKFDPNFIIKTGDIQSVEVRAGVDALQHAG